MGKAPIRPILAVARHEVRQLAGAFSGWTTRIGLAAAVLLIVLAWPTVQERGVHPDAGLYPVEVEAGAALQDAVQSDARFRPAAPGEAPVLRVAGAGATPTAGAPPGASSAALEALREATLRWQEAQLGVESDQAAAFPVRVNLVFATRDLTAATGGTIVGPGAPDAGRGGSTSGGGASGAGNATATDLLNSTLDARQQTDLTPAQVEPPFPVRSLLLTFAYLIPLNFLGQLYAGSLLSERVRNRGLLTLTAPMAPGAVLAGRSLPYVLAGGIVYVASSIAVGVGPLGWAAAIPIVAFVLVAALVIGNTARSPRELTFLLTGVTTLFSTFLFLPAVFAALPPIAFLSPVSVLAASIEGQSVSWGAFLYATVPLALSCIALAFIGTGLHRAETLYSQASIGHRLRLAAARWTSRPIRLVLAGALLVPFAMALQLLVLAFVIPLGLVAAFPAIVIGAAVLEEALKLLVTSTRTWRNREGVARPGWMAGILVGIGFFLGEKLALLVGLAGFGGLELGLPTLRILGATGSFTLLIGPLLLHVACAAIAGLGVARPKAQAWAWWGVAVLLHIAYNLAVLAFGGRM